MALAGEVRPASQRRRALSFALNPDDKLEDRRRIQDSFAGTMTPLLVLRQKKLEAAAEIFEAVLLEFLSQRPNTTRSLVAVRAMLPLQASLELHDEKSATQLLALRWFETALEQEKLAVAKYQDGFLRTASLLEARLIQLSAAVHLLQVSQPKPER